MGRRSRCSLGNWAQPLVGSPLLSEPKTSQSPALNSMAWAGLSGYAWSWRTCAALRLTGFRRKTSQFAMGHIGVLVIVQLARRICRSSMEKPSGSIRCRLQPVLAARRMTLPVLGRDLGRHKERYET